MADNPAIAQENPVAAGEIPTPSSVTPVSAGWTNLTRSSAATTQSAAASHMATRTGFLGLFIVVSFLGNLTLVATVCQSRRLRRTSLNLFVVSAACFNLVNCVVNMPLVMGATIKERWEYGDFICRMNAAFTQLTKIGMLLSLMCMTVDRLAAVVQPGKYGERMGRARVNSLIVYTWLQAFAFFVVIWVPAEDLPSRYYPDHYLCSLAERSSLLYLILESLLCFLIPFLIICAIQIHIIKICAKRKLKKKNMVSRQSLDADEHHIWQDIVGAMFVGNLFIFWCVFEAPHIILSYINLYVYSKEVQSGVGSAEPLVSYPWQVDLAFTWMKFCFPTLLPILTFIWRKDVWKKFKNLILCRKSNHVNDSGPRLTDVVPNNKHIANHKFGAKNKPQEIKHDTYRKTQEHFNVPVLFATSNGIHVQTYVQKDSEDAFSDDFEAFTSDTQNSKSSDGRFVKSRKVDVAGSQADMSYLQMDGDTSDYDSQMEMDPFSISNPISVTDAHVERSKQIQHQNHELTTLDTVHNTDVTDCETAAQETVSPEKEKAFDSGIYHKDTMKNGLNEEKTAETQDIPHVAERPVPEFQECTGNDSGTGSVEEHWSHNIEKVRKNNMENHTTIAEIDKHEQSQTHRCVDDLDSTKTSAPAAPTVTGDSEASGAVVVSNKPEKNKHKKKKKKSKHTTEKRLSEPLSMMTKDDNHVNDNEFIISHVDEQVIESNNYGFVAEADADLVKNNDELTSQRRRPARLKPLEYKSHRSTEHSPLRTPKILTPRSKLSKEELASLENFAHRNNDVATTNISSHPVQHCRTSSEESQDNHNSFVQENDKLKNMHRHKENYDHSKSVSAQYQRQLDDVITIVHTGGTVDSVSRRFRRNTVDSQTALLGSNSSSDLSEIREINARKNSAEKIHENCFLGDNTAIHPDSQILGKAKGTQRPKSEGKIK